MSNQERGQEFSHRRRGHPDLPRRAGIDFEDLEDFEILKFQDPSHHLIKTFYTGPGGWTDPQMPDGTVILTAPTGHIYTTEPHGASMFPALAQSTGELPETTLKGPTPDRDVMMPRRKQTREQDRRDRINQERRQRTELIAEEERQRQAWLAANYEPPPF